MIKLRPIGWLTPIGFVGVGVIAAVHGKSVGALFSGFIAGVFVMVMANPWMDRGETRLSRIVGLVFLAGMLAALALSLPAFS